MIQPDSIGLYHPAVDADIVELVQYARDNGLKVRVRGAAQSIAKAIFTNGANPKGNEPVQDGINIMLNNYRTVTFNANSIVTVQAGCNLGFDPNDPDLGAGQTSYSTIQNGLFYQLAANKLAIPNMSDAIHQTVAGFISTGSSGGSIAHSFLEAIVSIKLIDGNGNIQVYSKPATPDPVNPFYAVGVSLGLLGIITEVTIQCIPAFNIIGMQSITTDDAAPMNFLGSSSSTATSLQDYLTNTEFTRLMWWPFPTVKRLVTWQARTMVASDYNQQTAPGGVFTPKEYKNVFPTVFGSHEPTELLADIFFTAIGNWQTLLTNLFGNEITIGNKTIKTSTVQDIIDVIWPFMLPLMLDVYFPLDNAKPPQQFWDYWNDGLPMDDNEYSNNLFPANHSEFWININDAAAVMQLLENYFINDYFKVSDPSNNNSANGCYTIEVFGAKQDLFWLSPGYNQDSIRINIFSFKYNDENVMDYFQQFWNLVKTKYDFRLHWGYYLPHPADSEVGAGYITSQYPMWQQFKALRETMDPKNVFLTDYWSKQLNL